MHQSESSSGTQQAGAQTVRSAESRRRMLRRSLGVAAPVVLTLGSAPVSAGMCVTASAFVSAATFASRQAKGVQYQPCIGQSPSTWAANTSWPTGVDRKTATFADKLGGAPISGFLPDVKLLEVLQQPATLEAHIAAVWLSAYTGSMASPFEDGDAVKAVWANIRANGGAYKPNDFNVPALTPAGTREWLAMTWQ